MSNASSGCGLGASDSDHEDEDSAANPWLAALTALAAVCNGAWSSKRFQHYCRDPRCCRNFDRKTTINKIANAVIGFLFRTVPQVPALSKWTKTGPCCDVVLAGLWCHGALRLVMDQAFQGSRLAGFNIHVDQDQAYVEETMWEAVAGVRLTKSLGFVRDPQTMPLLTIMAIVKEGLRWLTSGFLRCARAVRHPCEHPRLMDWVVPEFSRVTAVLQHYSHLLSGESSRLALLWGAAAEVSLDAWIVKNPSLALVLERSLLVASTWCFRRHELYFHTEPWILASVADRRLPMERRWQIAQAFCARAPCCHEPFFGARLASEHVRNTDDFFAEKWQMFLFHWASAVRCSTASVEFDHAGNRQRAKPSMAWSTFTAQYVNATSKALARASRTFHMLCAGTGKPEAPDMGTPRAPPASGAPAPAVPRRTLLRAQTPLDVFRLEKIRADKLAGRKFNPVSVAYWAEVKREFGELDAASLESLAARVAETRPIAKHERELRRERRRGASAVAVPPARSLPDRSAFTNRALVPPRGGCTATNCRFALVRADDTAQLPHPPVPAEPLDPTQTLSTRPITAKDFSGFFAAKKVTTKDTIRTFKTTMSDVGSDKGFPRTVRRVTACGPMCAVCSSPGKLQLYKNVLAQLEEFVKQVGAAKIGAADVFLAFVAHDGAGGVARVKIARLCSASARAGPLPPRQNFVSYNSVDGVVHSMEDVRPGLLLQLARHTFVPTLCRHTGQGRATLRSPFEQATVGSCLTYSEEQWCSLVCNAQVGTAFVQGFRIHTELLKLDVRRVTGFVADPVLHADSAPPAPPKGKARRPVAFDWLRGCDSEPESEEDGGGGVEAALAAPLGPPSDAAAEEHDWLAQELAAMLEDSELPGEVESILAGAVEVDSKTDEPVNNDFDLDLPPPEEGDFANPADPAAVVVAPPEDDADAPPCGAAEELAAPAGPTGPAAYASTPLSRALDRNLDVVEMQHLCHVLGIEVTAKLVIIPRRPDAATLTGRPIGQCRMFGMSPVLKCTCCLPGHADCNLIINTTGRYALVLGTLVRWQCAGVGQSCTHHLALRDQLREQFKSRPSKG